MSKLHSGLLYSGVAALAAIWLLAAAGAANAAPVVVVNHSFELPVQGDGNFQSVTPGGWTLVSGGGVGVFDPPGTGAGQFPGGGITGAQFLFSGGVSRLGQVTGETIDIGDTFNLTVAIGNRADIGFRDAQIHLAAADGTIIASSAVITAAGIAAGTFADVVVGFTATAATAGLGSGVQILLDTVGGSGQAIFDNVRLDATAVPEPATMSLFCAGVAGAISLRRRRKTGRKAH